MCSLCMRPHRNFAPNLLLLRPAGKKPGDPIEGQYIVVFDTNQVSTVAEGITE